jgi:hypothetical protein
MERDPKDSRRHIRVDLQLRIVASWNDTLHKMSPDILRPQQAIEKFCVAWLRPLSISHKSEEM